MVASSELIFACCLSHCSMITHQEIICLFALIISVATVSSCQRPTEKVASVTAKSNLPVPKDAFINYHRRSSKEVADVDTIEIDPDKDKMLLTILASLPDSAMGSSWEWTNSERKSTVDAALKNGYFLNENKAYNVKKLLNATHFFTQVVDGYWELKVFSISESNHLALAHHVTGDGDEFFAYQYQNSTLSSIPLQAVIPPAYLFAFFKSAKPAQCKIKPDDDFEIGLDYTFNDDTLTVSNYYAQYDSVCFNGNTLNLLFNKKEQKFDIGKVYWKASEG